MRDRTPPSSAGTPIGEAGMFNSKLPVKSVQVRTINSTNNFVHNMEGAPIEIVARNSQHNEQSKTPLKLALDLDNEKSPLSGFDGRDNPKRNKRMNSGSVYDSPNVYSRNNSGRRIVHEI